VVTKPFSLVVIAGLLMLWAYVFYVRAAELEFRGGGVSNKSIAYNMRLKSEKQ
jgi:hypothetical protein